MRGKSSAGGPPTPRATPARAMVAVASPKTSLDRGGAEGGAARRARVARGEELGPHVASDRVRKPHEHEKRADVAPGEARARGEGEERGGSGRCREGPRGERQRDGEEP